MRQQLAAAYRLAALFGWEDTLYTHFSVRLPGDGEPRFLINPFGMMFDEVTASNLIVVDMQNDFITGSLGTKEAEAILPKVLEKIRTYRPEQIFVTQDTHPDNYLETNEGRHLPVAHCIAGSEGHALNPLVAEALEGVPADHFICKPTFGSTLLVEKLKTAVGTEAPEIEQVGLCTGICVLSNAILCKATFPESDVSVDAACCACVTPQSHDTALSAMKLCQIDINNQGSEPWRQ